MDIQKKKKVALVLSGGGIKAAAFHIGVCLALKEKGFRFAGGTKESVRQKFGEDTEKVIRVYVGSSAGAFVSSILAAGYDVESLINAFQIGSGIKADYNEHDLRFLKPIQYRHIFYLNGSRLLKLLPDAILRKTLITGGLESLIKKGFHLNGLFTTKGLEKYLRSHAFIDNDFNNLGAELYIVATQLNHSRKAIFGPFPESYKTKTTKYINYAGISEAVAASTSLPPVFAPYSIKNQAHKDIYYYDGEIRETLSSHIASDAGADLVISSYSVEPYHFTNEIGSLHKFGIPVILNQALYQVIQQKIKKHIEWEEAHKQIYTVIDSYCSKNNINEDHRNQILNIIKTKLNINEKTDNIYIHPRPQNYEMFFVDHFSLNPKILERIVKIGFKSALSSLRSHGI